MEKSIVYLGLGSNIGNRLDFLKKAYRALIDKGIKIIQSSSIYETVAWGFESNTTFYNSVIECETIFSAETLLEQIQQIESSLGRTEKSKDKIYQSRCIDIDILFYNNEVINTQILNIPHPLIPERNFVLAPLNELIPNFIHPSLGCSIETLKKASTDSQEAFIVHFPILVN